ncbi:MAG TPA: tetratricopeptide repeat protein [Candidatus Nitrosotenuis sp.]|nr:tetratricopeptide repeat protein [Candidatus Nitrosotenuis sp.]
MARRAVALSLLFAFVLFPETVCAQTRSSPSGDTSRRTYTIRGTVRNAANERGIESIRVELRRFTGEVVSTTFSRSMGEFEFAGISNGNYVLVIEESPFETVREAIEIINTSRFGVNLYLRKLNEQTQNEPGTMVSTQELALPRSTRDRFRKALATLYDKHDARSSVSLLERVVKDAPQFSEGHHHLGVAFAESNRPAEAEQCFRKAIELADRTQTESFFALASLLNNQRRFTDAEQIARMGLARNSDAWQGHYELARALLGLQRNDEAERSVGEARRRRPDFAPLYLLVANIHIRRKEYPQLLAALDEFLRLDPNHEMAPQVRQMKEDVLKSIAKNQEAKAAVPKP